MDVKDTEKHERIIHARLSKLQLEHLILKAVSEQTGVSVSDLRKHGGVEIEKNMEGSPEYQRGFKASVSARIPLDAPA